MRTHLTLLFCIALRIVTVQAQVFTSVYSFNNANGALPVAGLVLQGGSIYGACEQGGFGSGTIFRVNKDGTGLVLLRNFINPPSPGGPDATPLLSEGVLYGTTRLGGAFGLGTVFKVDTNGTGFVVIKDFTGGVERNPRAGLVLSGGRLYGTTSPNAGGGTIFGIDIDGSNYAVLRELAPAEGSGPDGGLILSEGVLYGTAHSGGSSFAGTIFKISTNGSDFAVLKSFPATFGNQSTNTDGANLYGGLVVGGNTLYGTARGGGSAGRGTVFKINRDGTGFGVLKNFNGGDGEEPVANLLLSGTILYGVTHRGGTAGYGTTFQVKTDGTQFGVLKNFTGGDDGRNPEQGATLTLAGATLYGTTYEGGHFGYGVIYKIDLQPVIQTVGLVDGQFTLAWASVSNSVYRVQYTTNLTGGNWIDAGDAMTATNSIMFATIPARDPQGYLRVAYLP